MADHTTAIQLDVERARPFLKNSAWTDLRDLARQAHLTLVNGAGAGNEFLGWRRLLESPDDALLEDVQQTASEIRDKADVLLCIGIGGSYLGAKAVIQALSPRGSLSRPEENASGGAGTEIRFAGHHLSGTYLQDLLDDLEGLSVYVNVISKSGTTLEPAIAFRIVRRWMQDRFDDADRRIIVTTDPSDGALNALQKERKYRKYVIPRDVGGRFSVLTPVGLLPIAAAGIDIRTLFYGAVNGIRHLSDRDDNAALAYAAVRYGLLQEGYGVDVLATFEPRLGAFGAWWQQLFGESEGKQGCGLYPATAQYTKDLHSLGQYMQDGRRIVAETFLMVRKDESMLRVPPADQDSDGLAYLEGETMHSINNTAYEGAARAHADGGVPVQTIWLESMDARALGECLYFFQHAVAVGGYMLGVNPFNQPGVEAYKKEMFSRLGRPDGK